MNKSQAEKKVYAFHAEFRVDVNDVKQCFSSLLQGSGWLRAYQNDYVIDNYIEPAVI